VSAVFLPHRRTHQLGLGLLLIDLPVLVAVAIVGAFYGYRHVYWAVTDYRLEHPWSLLLSLVLAVLLVRRWRRA
jgi:hypothetical protein